MKTKENGSAVPGPGSCADSRCAGPGGEGEEEGDVGGRCRAVLLSALMLLGTAFQDIEFGNDF